MRELWHRVRFHLSLLALLVPISQLPEVFADHDEAHPNLTRHQVTAGPFILYLIADDEAPHKDLSGQLEKDITIAVPPSYIGEIRGIFVDVGDHPTLPSLEDVAHDGPYDLHTHMRIPDSRTGHELIRVTVETWSGASFKAMIPLQEVLIPKTL
jgi:hypothetical protein